MMGAMAQFMPLLAEAAGDKLSAAQKCNIKRFVKGMQFYTRRDLRKSWREDKHLFRVDDLDIAILREAPIADVGEKSCALPGIRGRGCWLETGR